MANKIQKSYRDDANNAIQHEIGRFESVHPNIYAIYELLDHLDDSEISENLKENIKEYVVSIEDSFVNSQEWTLPRFVNVFKLAIVGTVDSWKSTLVHRYLTSTYIHDESPEGGRFKKDIDIDGNNCLLLIRDEGGCPDRQMTQWADGIILVFSLENEQSLNVVVNEYYRQMKTHRDLVDVPMMLVGTQDMISDNNPRMVDDTKARSIASQLSRNCGYYETCATYGLNIDKLFQDICTQILIHTNNSVIMNNMRNNGVGSANYPTNGAQPLTHAHLTHHLRSRPTTPQVINNPNNAGLMMPHPHGALTQPKQRSSMNNNHNISNHYDHNNPNNNNFARTNSYVTSSSHANKSRENEEEPPPLPARPENMAPIRPMDSRVRLPLNTNAKSVDHAEFDASYMKSLPNRGSAHLKHQHNHQTPQLYHHNRHQQGSLSNDQSQLANNSSKINTPHVYSEYNMLMSSSNNNNNNSNRQTPNLVTTTSSSNTNLSNNSNNNSRFKTNSDRDLPPGANEKSQKTTNNQSNTMSSGSGNVIGSGRCIPIKQGYLYKKSSNQLNKDRKNRKYVTLTEDNKLVYYPNMNDYMNNLRGKEINLQLTTIKLPNVPYRNSCLPTNTVATTVSGSTNTTSTTTTMSSNNSAGPSNFNTPNTPTQRSSDSSNPPLVSDSMTTAYLADMGVSTDIRNTKESKNKRHRRMKSNVKSANDDNDPESCEFYLLDSDNRQWTFEGASMEERDEWVIQIETAQFKNLQLDSNPTNNDGSQNSGNFSSNSPKPSNSSGNSTSNTNILNKISQVSGNQSCADCSSNQPLWASVNLGVCICIECCGVHRQLGTHVTKVRSLTLDDWTDEYVAVMLAIGNTLANSVWEANPHANQVPNGSSTTNSNGSNNGSLTKPTPTSPRTHKEAWIRAKYESKLYLPPLPLAEPPIRQLVDALSRQDTRQVLLCLAVIGQSTMLLDSPYSEIDSRTPLHIAATLGNIVYIQLLLWAGASPNIPDHEGRTPFFYAYYANQQKASNFLTRICPNSCTNLKMLTTNSSGDLIVPSQTTNPNPNPNHNHNMPSYSTSATSTTLPRQHFSRNPPPQQKPSISRSSQQMIMQSHLQSLHNNNMMLSQQQQPQQQFTNQPPVFDNNNYIDFTTSSNTTGIPVAHIPQNTTQQQQQPILH